MRQLKTLVIDIETAPMLAYVWGRHDQNIALNQIKADWYVIAWAAKWLGDKPSKVVYHDQRRAKDLADDKALLRPLWKLLDEADIVLGQNSKSFDVKKLNARFIMHGWNPPSPYKHLDTYLIAKNAGAFTANSLEYLSDTLCTRYKKLKHGDFPGQMLWTECLKGNQKAWKAMQTYNVHDVLTTEELYGKLKAWAPKSMPSTYSVSTPEECGTCGLWGRVIAKGFAFSKGGKAQRYVCNSCGSWSQGKVVKEAA